MKTAKLHPKSRMKALSAMIFGLFCLASCSTLTDSQDIRPESDDEKKAARPDEISFWQDYPPETYRLTANQSSRLSEIVAGCEMIDPFGRFPKNVMVSPAHDLSSFTLGGESFVFVPPSGTHNFRLSAQKERMLREFMASEFGISKRWQEPKSRVSEPIPIQIPPDEFTAMLKRESEIMRSPTYIGIRRDDMAILKVSMKTPMRQDQWRDVFYVTPVNELPRDFPYPLPVPSSQ